MEWSRSSGGGLLHVVARCNSLGGEIDKTPGLKISYCVDDEEQRLSLRQKNEAPEISINITWRQHSYQHSVCVRDGK